MKAFIFLYGPPAVGKSTTGRALARMLNLPFVDLDQNIEQHAGQSIPSIFEQHGESYFRELESSALSETLSGETSIVALGGGALLYQENRKRVEEAGKIVCLTAPVEILQARLQQAKAERPLARDGQLEALLEKRQEHYASFPLQRSTADLKTGEISEQIQKQLGQFYVRGMGAGYPAQVETGGLQRIGDKLAKYSLKSPVVLIADSNVAPLYGDTVLSFIRNAGILAEQIVIPAGESHKNMETVSQIWEGMLAAKMERGGTVLALGGGVVNDLAGFAAATFMRGVAWVSLPSSLLSMVDASLGGKTGANLPAGKNLVGAFYPPRLVLADPETLKTLPDIEIRSGLAEVVKHAVIAAPNLFTLCAGGLKAIQKNWPQLVSQAMSVKIKIIQADPYEGGQRATLNFGHTIGHAIEALSDYSLRHGEAVAIGMVAETRLAEILGMAEEGLAEQLTEVLHGLALPTRIPKNINREEILDTLQVDKKLLAGSVRFALATKIGEVQPGIEIKNLAALIGDL